MRFQFIKMHGCGNDFLVYDQMQEHELTPLKPNEIRYICDRHFGIGADGFVILSKGGEKSHAAWRFYNNDGSEAEMCGNAARCAIRYLAENYFQNEEIVSIETRAGTIKGKVAGERDNIEVTLFGRGDLKPEIVEKLIRSDEEVVRCFCIDTGVPHAVIEVKDIRSYPITKMGKMIMHHPAFQPDQTNVTFFQQRVGPQIIATTYERGVEKETLACGTGAAAAALVFSELYVQPLPVTVSMPGGTLTVDASSVARRLLLRGEAQYICTANIDDIPSEFEPRYPYEGTST